MSGARRIGGTRRRRGLPPVVPRLRSEDSHEFTHRPTRRAQLDAHFDHVDGLDDAGGAHAREAAVDKRLGRFPDRVVGHGGGGHLFVGGFFSFPVLLLGRDWLGSSLSGEGQASLRCPVVFFVSAGEGEASVAGGGLQAAARLGGCVRGGRPCPAAVLAPPREPSSGTITTGGLSLGPSAGERERGEQHTTDTIRFGGRKTPFLSLSHARRAAPKQARRCGHADASVVGEGPSGAKRGPRERARDGGRASPSVCSLLSPPLRSLPPTDLGAARGARRQLGGAPRQRIG